MQRTPNNPDARLQRSISEFGTSLFSLARHPRLGRVLLGCGMFWFAGAILRSNLQGWGLASLQAAGVAEITNQKLALLKIGLIAGIVAGSLLAGQLHKVGELSWVRRYGFLLAASILSLGLIGGNAGLVVAVMLLIVTGLAAGLLLIPLNAALQHEGDHTKLGKTIAVQNFVDYFAMLLGAGFLQLLSKFNLTPGQVFIALAATLLALAVALRVSRPAPVPANPVVEHRVMKLILRLILRLCFGFRTTNTAVLATPGPVLLVPNHVSWLDWLFLYVALDGDWKFVASRTTAQTSWFHRRAMLNRRTFPVDTASPYAIREMAEYLEKGGRLVLFAEGRLSITGSLMKLFEGTGFHDPQNERQGDHVLSARRKPAPFCPAQGLDPVVSPRERSFQRRVASAVVRRNIPYGRTPKAHHVAPRPDGPATVSNRELRRTTVRSCRDC